MKKQQYHRSITTTNTPKEAFAKINDVPSWWAKNFEGSSKKINDVFTVRFGNGDMYKLEVAEMIPNKKIIWDVVDSYQGWHDNHTEWVDTKIIWEVIPQKDGVELTMTHEGLVPEFECYLDCSRGWDYLIQKSLFGLLTVNTGLPV